jgi:hypothetical protein
MTKSHPCGNYSLELVIYLLFDFSNLEFLLKLISKIIIKNVFRFHA